MALRKIATRISGGSIRMDAEAQTSAHGISTPMAQTQDGRHQLTEPRGLDRLQV